LRNGTLEFIAGSADGASSEQNMPSAEKQHDKNEQSQKQTAEHLLAYEFHWPR